MLVAKDRPDAGMGVKLVHPAANLASATLVASRSLRAGYLSDFVDVGRCGFKQEGRVNIFCYLEPFTPCASSNKARHVAVNIGGMGFMPNTRDAGVGEPNYATRMGSFWYEAQVLKYMWS